MKKAVLLAAILAGAILSPAFAANPPKVTVQSLRVNDKNLSAAFECFDETGCKVTDIVINAGTSVEVNRPGGKTKSPLTGLSINVSDLCEAEVFVSGGGSTSNQVVHIADDLSSGSVYAVVPMADNAFGNPFEVTVYVTWTATGPKVSNKSRNIDRSTPGMVVVTETGGFFRDAQATGMVVVTGGTLQFPQPGNLIPLPSQQAQIQHTTQSTITITRQ